MKQVAVERDWKARRNGAIYCAPACGGGCTWAAYQAAKEAALALCKRMDTPGWKPYVHENLGWHWSIVKGGIAVYPSMGENTYWAGFQGGTPCEVSVGDRVFKNPNDAVKAQVDAIQAVIDKWQIIVKSVRAAVEPRK